MNSNQTYIVRVKPGTRQSKVIRAEDGSAESFIVWTRARAVDGKANEEVINLLSKYFGVPKRKVGLLSGHTSRIKRVILHKS